MTNKQVQPVAANTSKQTPQQTQPTHKQPRRRDLVLHFFKSFKMIEAVLWDKRVSVVRKVAYLGGMGILLVLLLFPEVLADSLTLLTPLFSLAGVEIPVEGGIDWMALGFASFSLLTLFPKEVLGEHYERIFHK